MLRNIRSTLKSLLGEVSGINTVADFVDILDDVKMNEVAKRLPAVLLPPVNVEFERIAQARNAYDVSNTYDITLWIKDRKGRTDLLSTTEELLENIFAKLVTNEEIEIVNFQPVYEIFPAIAYKILIRYRQNLNYGAY